MAQRRRAPKQPKSIAAEAAIFVTAAIFSLPALATTQSPMPCPKSEPATLTVPKNELIASKVSHDISYTSADKPAIAIRTKMVNPASLLAPRAEAAIREAFEDSSSESATPAPAGAFLKTTVTPPMADVETGADPVTDDTETPTESGMTTRLPGVSDAELSRFKKQMFRRDI
tara:strand:+ start:15132 stop:15647 length:516 start_codon:yes stop_codon:yes gene_type:complete